VLAHLSSMYAARSRDGQGLVTTVDDLVSWAVGYLGEAEVGERLAGLDGRWRVLHAVPLGVRSKDLDHLVIGPGGMFAMNTKRHPGARVTVKGRDALYVNGNWKPYLRDARRDAATVRDLLTPAGPIDVQAVICLVDGRLTVTTPGEGVHVVDVDDVVGWLTGLPDIVDADLVNRVYDLARRADTWPGHPVPAAPDGADGLARNLADREPAHTGPQPAGPAPAPRPPALPTQHARASGRPNGRPPRPTSVLRPSRQRSRRPSAGRRRRHGARGIDLLKGVLALAVLLAIILAGPERVTALLRPLADFVTHHFVANNFPQPTGTDPALPTHGVGTACPVRGDRARSVRDGSQIQCLPPPNGGGLHWQRFASGATVPQTGH
jgi:hypothetical protein